MKNFVKGCLLGLLLIGLSANLNFVYAQTGLITTIAGTGFAGYTGDSVSATATKLNSPSGIVADGAGNIYIADLSNSRVRKIDASGIITTFAGNGTIGGSSGDGLPATDAELLLPYSLAMDGIGNLYIGCREVVRMVNPAGIISTVAGVAGSFGYNGDGHPATATTFHPGCDLHIATDNLNNVYICSGCDNRVVRFNPASGGIVTTVAGTGGLAGAGPDGVPATTSPLNMPYGITVDATGNLYLADGFNFRIRKVNPAGIITTIGGNGTGGFAGDYGPATAAQIMAHDLCFDSSGNLYVADGYTVRRIDTSGIIHPYAGRAGVSGTSGDNGPATNAKFNFCTSMTWTNGSLYITDQNNNRVRKIHGLDEAPAFIAGVSTSFSVCKNDPPKDISSLLHIYDTDSAQTETWAIANSPSHGTAAVSYSSVSTGSILTPSGITYQPTADYSGSDNFRVVVNDGVFSDTIFIAVLITDCHAAAVSDFNTDGVKVFPNPATEELTVSGNQLTAYKLYNPLGACLLHGSLHQRSNNTVSLQGIPAGIYTLELTSADGERKMVRIVKE